MDFAHTNHGLQIKFEFKFLEDKSNSDNDSAIFRKVQILDFAPVFAPRPHMDVS